MIRCAAAELPDHIQRAILRIYPTHLPNSQPGNTGRVLGGPALPIWDRRGTVMFAMRLERREPVPRMTVVVKNGKRLRKYPCTRYVNTAYIYAVFTWPAGADEPVVIASFTDKDGLYSVRRFMQHWHSVMRRGVTLPVAP